MGDIEPCPHCQRDDFGNKGARTQHVRSCAEQAKKYQENGQQDTKSPQIEPATSERQQAVEPAGGDLAGAGEQLAAGMSSALDEDAPVEQRKSGVKKLGELVTGALGGIMEHREQKAQQEEQRARNTDLQEVSDKPECTECGLTFSKIPANADRISCPECGREYQVR